MTRPARIVYDPARKMYLPRLTEEMVLSQIRQYLEFNGFRVDRITERIPRRDQYGRIRGRVSEGGLPDLMARKRTMVAFIEVKRPGGPHRFKQEQWIRDAQADGLIAFFAESIDQVRTAFAEAGIALRGE